MAKGRPLRNIWNYMVYQISICIIQLRYFVDLSQDLETSEGAHDVGKIYGLSCKSPCIQFELWTI